jgi:uncharacterized protein YndB with AHSA1/START domain
VNASTQRRRSLAVAFLAGWPLAGSAEIKLAAPDAFLIEQRYAIAAPAAKVWDTLLHPEAWWPSDHTWSGDRRNLRLSGEAGACFCERWAGGSVEHGRVVMAIPKSLLRLDATLGPLQEMALSGVITIALAEKDGKTEMVVTHRASGDASHKLDAIAPIVDQVNAQQFGALAAAAAKP